MIIDLFDPTTQKLFVYDYDSVSSMIIDYTPESHNLSNSSDVSFHELLNMYDG